MADTYDLEMVQNEPFVREFGPWTEGGVEQTFTGWVAMAQIRRRERMDSQLLMDLTPYFEVVNAGATLRLDVPATAWAGVPTRPFNRTGGAYWDLFLVDALDPSISVRFMQGRVTLDPAVTSLTAVTP